MQGKNRLSQGRPPLVILVCFLGVVFPGWGAIGQTEPPRIPSPRDLLPAPAPIPLPAPVPQPPPPVDLTPAVPAPEAPLVPNRIPGTIVVKRFEVVGSTVFSTAELAQVTAPFTNRPITFAELLQAQAEVTKYYTDRGYITSGAVIPPQTLEADVVRIQVVEGSLEAINVVGTRRLNPNYVRSRLAIATQQPLNNRRLLEALQLLQLNPLIQTISAELSAGTRPGSNLLDVKVAEADTFNLQVALNNGRSPAVGTFRRQLQVSEANLLGLGDSLSIGYANTRGSNIGDISYVLPVNPRNGTVSFRFSLGGSLIVEQPFDQIDFRANSRTFDLTYRQPLLQTPSQELALGATLSHQRSQTFILGVPLAVSPGANDQGQSRVSALRFFQEWTERRAQSVFAARSQFSVGLNALGATINESGPDSQFFSWRGQVQWARLLAADTLLLLRSDLQLADRPLLPLEQFGLGGQESIRGYRQDLLLTDNGLLATAELRLPILRVPKITGLLQVAPFIELGKAWNRDADSNPDPSTLASLGLGLVWQQGDRFSARLDWGIPLVPVASERRTWQENGVYFSVVYNLF